MKLNEPSDCTLSSRLNEIGIPRSNDTMPVISQLWNGQVLFWNSRTKIVASFYWGDVGKAWVPVRVMMK